MKTICGDFSAKLLQRKLRLDWFWLLIIIHGWDKEGPVHLTQVSTLAVNDNLGCPSWPSDPDRNTLSSMRQGAEALKIQIRRLGNCRITER